MLEVHTCSSNTTMHLGWGSMEKQDMDTDADLSQTRMCIDVVDANWFTFDVPLDIFEITLHEVV